MSSENFIKDDRLNPNLQLDNVTNLNIIKINPLPTEVINFFLDLTKIQEIEQIIVFGSRAHLDDDPTSDIDIAINAPGLSKIKWLKIVLKSDDVKTLLKIGLVQFNSNPIEFQKKILDEGVIIYEQKKIRGQH